jgi:hypothetical protein
MIQLPITGQVTKCTRPVIRPPRVRVPSFPPSIRYIYSIPPSGSMDFALFGELIQRYPPLYVVRVPRTGGAACFLRIPCLHGHPCIKLTITIAFMARDSHPMIAPMPGAPKKWSPKQTTTSSRAFFDYSLLLFDLSGPEPIYRK